MPRAEHDPAVVTGLRATLIVKARAEVVRLATADSDVYDFSAELQRQRDRVDALLEGRDVTVYRFEIPGEHQPPRDGTVRYTLRGDRLVASQRTLTPSRMS
jgi:hypothetical protein